ncbi:MAG: hypothetical protein HY320_08365 [Armatimonadetes bacterium]|nr:hypothetical protein [Armatimonadota bacterium]
MATQQLAPVLPVVHAYADHRPVLDVKTRWEPRRVWCTRTADHADAPGQEYVVKFRRPGTGTAALISEVVCHALLQALGLPSLVAARVSVGERMARSYNDARTVDYEVLPGLHFGTAWRPDVQAGPPESWEQLADPEELVRIWAADCWLMTPDRRTYGNILLADPDSMGRFHLIPADQSDCFLGSGSLQDGSYTGRSADHGAAPYLDLLERAFVERGCVALHDMARRIAGATAAVPTALKRVPDEWWAEAEVNQRDLAACLHERANRARIILEIEKWEGLGNATAGGHLFDL